MNVSQLQPLPQPHLQRLSREATERDADFLALRLLNKRSRLRLSPQPLDLDALPGRGRLFAVANRAAWFAAAIRNPDSSYAVVLSPLTELRAVFSSSTSDGPLAIQPRVTLPLPATPHLVLFTQDDARLLVAFTNGPISVYDAHNVFQTSAALPPLHTFPSPTGKPVRDILPSPGDMELVAVLRDPTDAPSLEILDLQKMSPVGGWTSGGSPPTNPVSVSWSPKGKQIAIGLESGDIVTFSPTDTSSAKTFVPRPQGVDGQSIISTVWLSNPEFHAIYVPAGQFTPDVEQSHYILSLDSKANTAGDVKLNSPYLPFPGLRPPGSFVVVLRNWEPSRLLLFVGDSTSSDIGLIGSLANSSSLESWYNFTLEETSTPSVPLDADMNETVLLGLELDLTNDKPFQYTGPSGEETDVPPPPIMYLYASDGTLTGWHIIQTQGAAYPGMAAPSATPASISPAVSTTANPANTPQSVFASPVAPARSPSQSSAFGATTTPGTGLGFGAFSGAPAAFGSTSFGFSAQTSPTQSLQAPALSTPSMSVEMASASEDPMVSETDSGLGGMSLGGEGESAQPKPGAGTSSMFGSFGAQQQNTPSTSPFGGGATASPTFAAFGAGPVKPATGFGAFASNGPSAFGASSSFGSGGAFGSSGSAFGGGSSAFGSKSATDAEASKGASTETKPASAFGQSGFGQSGFGAAAAKPAFGQSGFGQTSFGQSSFGKPAFGQSAFGSSSFGSSTTPTKPPATSAFGSGGGGGFAAFASAPTSFASAAQQATGDGKPAWASGAQTATQKPAEASSSPESAFGGAAASSKPAETTPTTSPAGGAFAGLGQGSAFGKPSFGQSSFGQPSSGQSAFGQPAFGQSAFGKSAFGQPATSASTSPGAPTTPSSGGFAGFATAGPSAFGAAATQKSPSNETKPVWATADADKPKTENQQSKSAFGDAPNTLSAFGSSQTAKPSEPEASTTPTSSPEKPAAPATPAATPPATPAPKPVATSAASTTPATPATGGAFGGLTTSTTGFSNLGTGFGAFGGTTPTSSPFLQKPATTSQSSSLFGQTSFGAAKTDEKDDTTKPTSAFGSPSPLGQTSFFGKSSFGSSSSPFAKPVAPSSSAPTTSAFSAFSSAPSPFAAAASGAKKSFGEMLREKEGEQTEETKPQGVSKTAEEWKKPVSVFASLKQAAVDRDVKEEEDDEAGNVSFRSQDDDEDAEEGSEAGDDGIDDFLKSDEEDEGSEEEEPEEEGEVVQSQTPPESPTAKQPVSQKAAPSAFVGGVFLSKDARSTSRSPSLSPVPIVKVEPESPKSVPAREPSATPPGSPERKSPPLPDQPSPDVKGKAPARETSTTPPGSPATAPSAAVTRATSAPPTSSPTAPAGAGLLGLGRPSTRPTRSSPLANQPISGDDVSDEDEEQAEEEEEDTAPSSSPKKARSASPVIPATTAKGRALHPTSRPKTPPLLFGGLGGPAKPPTPSPFSLSPAAPPPLFASTSTSAPTEQPAEPIKPPNPAAAPSLKGPGTPGSSSIFGAPPVFSPPAAPQGSLFGQKPTTPPGGLFGQKPAPPMFGSPGLSAQPAPPVANPSSPAPVPAPVAVSTDMSKPVPSFFGGSSFGSPGQPAKMPAFGGFGRPPVPPAAPIPSAFPGTLSQPPPPSQAAVAQGMQTECLYLFSTLAKELEDLKALANRAKARAAQLNRPGSGNKTAQDLVDPTKWIMGDLPQFKQIMKEVEQELEKWEKEKATCISHIRELESDMLKATTRKEEILRFSKASQDAEFARMLKARTLNPEHLETQAQLRREIRTIRGRIQQLEDHIQASKKKLNSVKNGKPSLKPPSLDTINRTYRNIDLAIEQEEVDVSALADRVAQLDLAANPRGMLSFSTTSTRDKRLPDRAERVGREVTPNIAASTAAALNAERSAQKLKRALLKARKEPLLNTKAVDALPPAREPRMIRKPLLAPDSGLGVGAAFVAGMNNGISPAPALGFDPGVTGRAWIPPPPGSFGPSPAWSAPSPSNSDPGSPPTRLGVTRGPNHKQHTRAAQGVPLVGSKPPPPPPPAGFSWGPVPRTEPKQMLAGFQNFGKPKLGQPEVNVKAEETELGSSWITDGFASTGK
ncbi:hypothetical protein OH77DRAFT_1514617 [Trametes cingulata]|nr:hypothetical protein OH77DRAFT_1514617 [Trametes cingulata]